MQNLRNGAGLCPEPRTPLFAGTCGAPRCVVVAASLCSALILAPMGAHAQSVAPALRQFDPQPTAEDFDFGPLHARAENTFTDTLPVHCLRPPHALAAAIFAITLRNPATGAQRAQPLRLSFWDRGIEHFILRVWSGHELAGAVKTLRFDLAALPPAGGPVLRNTGHGMRLLRNRDFSFSVSDRTAVVQATLSYRCADDAFSFASTLPLSVFGDYRRSDNWRSAPPMGRPPYVPQRRDAPLGRLSSGFEFE